MKKILLQALALTLILCSCRTGTTEDGKSCYELDDSDKTFMVDYTRQVLTGGRKQVLRAGEAEIISRTEPKLKMTYYGDKCGVLTVTWRTRTREIGMLYDGVIRSGYERMHLISEENAPAVVDYSGLLSEKAKRNVERIKVDGDAQGRLIPPR